MHFVLQTPFLEHLVEVKIVATLWNQRDMFTQIAQSFHGLPWCYIREGKEKWNMIEDKVKYKVSALPLPQLHKDRLCNLIKPLGIEIVDWCRYHSGDNKPPDLADFLPRQFCWTMHGTVDYAKTAELMIKDEGVNMHRRLELACINGLEDAARELIELVPAERRRKFYVNTLSNVVKDGFYHLIILVTNIVNCLNSLTPFHNYKYPLQAALCSGNRAMCEYLFTKLRQEEREQVLEDCEELIVSCKEVPTSSLLYYLSLMNEEQQKNMFGKSICDLLVCLLRWPAQSLFMEAAKCGWQYGGYLNCSTVLLAITLKIRLGFRDYDYSQLFWEFWRFIPAKSASHVLQNSVFIESLLLTKREEFVKLIFNETPASQIFALCYRYHEIEQVLMDESSISDAALMECKQTAAIISSKNEADVEKRTRSDYLSRLVDLAMESRAIQREKKV